MPTTPSRSIAAARATAIRCGIARRTAAAARTISAVDDRGIEDMAETRRSLRDHLGEQLRLSFHDPVDRIIGAHLIALLCPAGRLTAEPAAIARAMNVPLERIEAVRARMMRFDPVGLFARDLKECLGAQLAERNRLDPAMAALLDNLDLLARREMRRLAGAVRRRCRGPCRHDRRDPRARSEAGGELRCDAAAAAGAGRADARGRPAADWLLELNPETMPRVLVNQGFYARVVTTRRQGGSQLPGRAAADRELAGEVAAAARADHPEGGGRDRAPAGRVLPASASAICGR